jgi:hypothetical protein
MSVIWHEADNQECPLLRPLLPAARRFGSRDPLWIKVGLSGRPRAHCIACAVILGRAALGISSLGSVRDGRGLKVMRSPNQTSHAAVEAAMRPQVPTIIIVVVSTACTP